MSVRAQYGFRAITIASIVLVLLMQLPHAGLAQVGGCPEPNDSQATACALASGATVSAFVERSGDVDAYRIVVDADVGRISLELADLTADYDLTLADEAGGVYASSVQEGTAAERIEKVLLTGTYFAYVHADPGREADSSQPYRLSLSIDSEESTVRLSSDGRRVLLADDFDDPARSALPISSRRPQLFTLGYVDGEYSIVNHDLSGRIWGPILPGRYEDSVLAVRIRLVGDTDDRLVALACRRQDMPDDSPQGAMYRLHVLPGTRQVDLLLWEGQTRRLLATRRGVSAVGPGDAWNDLELSCIKSRISARVNGETILSVEDGTHRIGSHTVGVGSRPSAIRRAEARIDDLAVYGP